VPNNRTLTRSIVVRWKRSVFALCAVAFLADLAIGLELAALPWKCLALGGSDLEVGSIGAAFMGVYMGICLLLGRHADRVSPKRMVALSLAAMAVLMLAMAAAPAAWLLLVLAGLHGASMALLWPPLMGWLSTGSEGAGLNRRLSTFNACWSVGLILGSVLGGRAAEWALWLPFALAVVAALAALLVVLLARKAHPRPTTVAAAAIDAERATSLLPVFRLMSRVALVLGWIGIGALRFPLTLLVESMSLGPSAYGSIVAGSYLALSVGFVLLGRTHRWHFNAPLFWGCQLAAAAMILAVAFSRGGLDLALYTIAASLALSVLYVAGQYYGVSGAATRARSMAMHEGLLSVGFAVGSLGGGAVSQFIGVRGIYPVASAAIVASVGIQVVLYLRARARRVD